MNIGIVGYRANTGMGNWIKGCCKHLDINSHFMIPHPFGNSQKLDKVRYYEASNPPTAGQIKAYFQMYKPQILLLNETPFNFELFEIAKKYQIKIILVTVIDAISYKQWLPYTDIINLFLCPTKISYKLYKQHFKNVKYLPYPMDTEYFHPSIKKSNDYFFLHNQGSGGAHFRKGSFFVYKAFDQITQKYPTISLYINRHPLLNDRYCLPDNIKQMTINIKDFIEARDTYQYGQVYLAPSNREGIGMPILEAMSCGMPVITTNAPPMNSWFDDSELLIDVVGKQQPPHIDASIYHIDLQDLINKMEYIIQNPDMISIIGKRNREIIMDNYSWNKLKPKFEKIFGEL